MVGTGKAYAKSKCYLAAATSLTFLKHIRPPASIAFYVLQCDATTALVAPSLSPCMHNTQLCACDICRSDPVSHARPRHVNEHWRRSRPEMPSSLAWMPAEGWCTVSRALEMKDPAGCAASTGMCGKYDTDRDRRRL